MRETGDKCGRMRIDASARCPALGDHQQLRDAYRSPAASSGDLLDVPDLSVEGREHRLDIRNHGRRGWMPGEDVEGAALAADRIRDLWDDVPTGPPEQEQHVLHEAGVIGIEKPVGRLALPIDADEGPSIERRSDSGDRVQPHAPGPASLDPGDERLRNRGALSKIDLAPSLVHSDRSNDATYANDVHRRRVANPRYPALIGRSLR